MVLGGKWIEWDKEWAEQAKCKDLDTEVFFPGRGEAVAPIKLICNVCPVVKPCLEYAMKSGEKFGVWGGTSERERRRIRGLRGRQQRKGIKLPLSRLMHMCSVNITSLKEEELVQFSGDEDFYR
jgi:WhiB family redox-sensing transcriptional regulator